jgi:Circularly permutated YpsA SLOG family
MGRCLSVDERNHVSPAVKIISGGQTGVDRAALDAALALGNPYGGWCPHGGWAEDFPDPPGVLIRYPLLQETPSADPAQRTEWNIRDADATLILVAAGGLGVSPGTALGRDLAEKYGKPLLVIDLDGPHAVVLARDWLRGLLAAREREFTLGIGGPRESEAEGIYERAGEVVRKLLANCA